MSDGLLSQEELDALLNDHAEAVDNGGALNIQKLAVGDFLDPLEEDILAEIGTISMGSAATALSTLVNRKVKITVLAVYISTPQVVSESYPIPCVVVNVEYLSGLAGTNILVIREQDALVIGNLMMA